MISTIEPEEEDNNNNNNNNNDNKTSQQERPRRTLYCIGCDSTKEADYVVGAKNLPLCHEHWEVFASVVLEKRSVLEEEEWT